MVRSFQLLFFLSLLGVEEDLGLLPFALALLSVTIFGPGRLRNDRPLTIFSMETTGLKKTVLSCA